MKHNNCLLVKWLWRYNEERQSLWKDFIKYKYGENGFGYSNVSTEPCGVGVWRYIRNLWSKFEPNLQINVGDGRRTRFWWGCPTLTDPTKNHVSDLFILPVALGSC